jgi:hypothetical protein
MTKTSTTCDFCPFAKLDPIPPGKAYVIEISNRLYDICCNCLEDLTVQLKNKGTPKPLASPLGGERLYPGVQRWHRPYDWEQPKTICGSPRGIGDTYALGHRG